MTDGDNTVKHIDAYAGPDVESNSPMHEYGKTWPFEDKATGNPVSYQWVPGTHKFFGWLAKDAYSTPAMTAEGFFGKAPELLIDPSLDDIIGFKIPEKAMTKDTPQFDFMYSNIYTTEPINTPVPLEFSHLFSAFYITGLNRDDANQVRVKEITLSGLDGTKSAEINFEGEETAVTYNDAKGSTSFSFTYTGELLSTTEKTLSDKYLIWPQTADDFADATLFIKYDYTSDDQTTEQERTIPLNSITEWKAGVVNSIDIVIDVDQITFYINSLEEWNTEEKDIFVEM